MCVGVFLEVVAIVVCCQVYDQFGRRQPDIKQHELGLVLEVDGRTPVGGGSRERAVGAIAPPP